MSSLAFLLQCPDRQSGLSGGLPTENGWCMRWNIPLIWYACFTPDDLITRRLPDSDIDYPAFFSPAAALRERLITRKPVIINALPEAIRPDYATFYDQTMDRLVASFTKGVLLEVSDFFSIMEFEPEAMTAFVDEVRLVDQAARGEVRLDIDALPQSGAFNIGTPSAPANRATKEELAMSWRLIFAGGPISDQAWPPAPQEAEIDLAAGMTTDKPSFAVSKPWWKFW